jgi:hypothetical protein
MDRKEVCALIREHELGEEVKRQFGDNYTRIPTKKLEQLLWDYDSSLVDEYPYDDGEELVKKAKESKEAVENTTPAHDGSDDPTDWENKEAQEVDNPYEAACYAFVGILKDSGLLNDILATL